MKPKRHKTICPKCKQNIRRRSRSIVGCGDAYEKEVLYHTLCLFSIRRFRKAVGELILKTLENMPPMKFEVFKHPEFSDVFLEEE